MRTPIERTVRPLAGPGGLPLAQQDSPVRELPVGMSSYASGAPGTRAVQSPSRRIDASPAHLYDLGLTAAAMSYHTAAIEALRDCTTLAPNHAPAWHKLAELLRLAGQDREADAADSAARQCDRVEWKTTFDKRAPARLQKAERELLEPLRSKTEADAAQALREHLVKKPGDPVGMRWLARLEARSGDTMTARALLERSLQICPGYVGAREEFAQLLIDDRDYEAIEQTRQLLATSPDNARYMYLHAHALIHSGQPDPALGVLTDLLREEPHIAAYWLLYGSALRAMGRREEAVQAYRKSLEVQPDMGEAWWGLAELKDKVLTQGDVAEMRAHLENNKHTRESRMHMLYALGQTLERAKEFPASFAAYEEAARVFWETEERKPQDKSVSLESVSRVQRIKSVFSRENLASRLVRANAVWEDTPIFVIGLPRAGSTLVEQILSAHSLVEAIGERSLIGDIARELAHSRIMVEADAYPDCLLEQKQEQLAALGSRVIARSRDYRTTARPYFVDKRPWNWLDVGLIHLILPQAKIIDIRREPMAACFAMYKQLLPRRSCAFSYDLQELGRYYKRYVNMMEHWQAVLPGRVHFVQYERLVEDTETEIRRMLDYCELPFEDACLRFWESDRAIVTPSAEQVRRPIFRDALQQWQNYEPWLGPLKESLAQSVQA